MLTFNVSASTEVMGACGRADITAEAGDYLYVFELKVTDNSKDIDTETAPKIGLVAHFNLSLVAHFNFGLSARFNFGLIA